MAHILAKIPLIQVRAADMKLRVKFHQKFDDGSTETEEVQKDPGGDVERSLRIL
jgi:hypothetical protein